MNNFEEEEKWVYGKALKREGANFDGETVGIKLKDALSCCRCQRCATALYAKKYGLIIKDLNKFNNFEYYCDNCRSGIGKCFLCQKYFESTKDLTGIDKSQINCKDCR